MKLVTDWRSKKKKKLGSTCEAKNTPALSARTATKTLHILYMHVVHKLYDISEERVNVFSTTAQQMAAGF